MYRLACLALLLAPSAFAQVPAGIDPSALTGAGLGGVGLDTGPAIAPARSQLGNAAAPSSSAGAANPESLFGLERTDAPKVLTLEDAMRRAVTANYDLRIARERVIQQEAGVRRAWAALLPNASLSGAYTYNCTFLRNPGEGDYADCGDVTLDSGAFGGGGDFGLLFTSLGDILAAVAEFEDDPVEQERLRQQAADLHEQGEQASQPVDSEPIVIQPAQLLTGRFTLSMPLFNGRSIPLLQNAYAAVDAVTLAGSQAQRALMLAVARAYYAAFTAKKLVAIAGKQRDSAVKHRDATKVQVEVRTATALSLRRAELDVIRAQQSVRAAESGFRFALGALGSILGINEEFDVVEPGKQPSLEQSIDVEATLEQAVRSRQDLKAQKLAVQIADRGKLDAWMMFLPSLALSLSGSATSNTGGFNNAPINGALAVTATIPLYDGGARYAALKESSSRVREELLKVRQLEEKIAGQVRGNLDDIELKKSAVELSREAAAVAKQAADQAQALIEVGAATPLDVSDANLAVFAAEVDLARAELDLEQARLGLGYVIGSFPGPLDAAPPRLTEGEAKAARDLLEKAQ
jgi:outer membrane protein